MICNFQCFNKQNTTHFTDAIVVTPKGLQYSHVVILVFSSRYEIDLCRLDMLHVAVNHIVEVCGECEASREQVERQLMLQYTDATLYVRKVTDSLPVQQDNGPESSSAELTSKTSTENGTTESNITEVNLVCKIYEIYGFSLILHLSLILRDNFNRDGVTSKKLDLSTVSTNFLDLCWFDLQHRK